MNTDIKETISAVKGSELFEFAFWIRLLCLILFVDIFLTLSEENIQTAFMQVNWLMIIAFVLGGLFCIALTSIVVTTLNILYKIVVYYWFQINNNSKDYKYKYYLDDYKEPTVGVDKVQEYAIDTNNQVAYDLVLKAKKSKRDRQIVIGALVVVIFDIVFGSFRSSLQWLISDEEWCQRIIAVTVLSIIIAIPCLFCAIDKADYIRIHNDALRKKITNIAE